AVEVLSYNVELKDENGFVGDRASKAAFRQFVDEWRKPLRRIGQDPFGKEDSAKLAKKSSTIYSPRAMPVGRDRAERDRIFCAGAYRRAAAFPQTERMERRRASRLRRRLFRQSRRRARHRSDLVAVEERENQDRGQDRPQRPGRGRPDRCRTFGAD